MELTKNDDLDEDKIYYVVSVPRDEAGSL